jgi:hypothetical protein
MVVDFVGCTEFVSGDVGDVAIVIKVVRFIRNLFSLDRKYSQSSFVIPLA